MSLLLEALKRAALEKQGRHLAQSGGEPAPAVVVPPGSSEAGIGEHAATDKPVEIDEAVVIDEFDWDESLVFDIDIDSESESESESESDNGLMTDDSQALAAADLLRDDAAEQAGDTESQAMMLYLEQLQEEQEAENNARLADNARQSALAEEAQRLARQAQAVAQQRQDKSLQANAAALAEQAKVDTARQAAEQASARAQSQAAMALMIANGQALSRRSVRRSRFLYSLLVLTAIGSISAYYVYLLGSESGRVSVAKVDNRSVPFAVPVINPAPAVATAIAGPEFLPEADANALTNTTDDLASAPMAADRPPAASTQAQEIPRTDAAPRVAALLVQLTSARQSSVAVAPSVAVAVPRATTESPPAERVVTYNQPLPAKLSGVIQRAYGAYKAGDLAKAEQLYDQALEMGPKNRDAMLGAAAVATTRGHYDRAYSLYLLRLKIDPADSHARAGLLALTAENALNLSEIDALLRVVPEAAHLHFLKGAYYASRQQWPAAQQAYFEALRLEPNNPDYTFNLAVSLDQLGKANEAVGFYEQAIGLGQQRPYSFSLAVVQQRLAEMAALP